jgi:hypothetical protein
MHFVLIVRAIEFYLCLGFAFVETLQFNIMRLFMESRTLRRQPSTS